MGDDMRTQTEEAVAEAVGSGANIDMINADPAFEGHETCDSDNWINYVSTGGAASILILKASGIR
jgi:hypothetical protein